MDVRMPGIDGLKATKFIRKELGISGSVMPVVGISAACTNEDRLKYKKAGMNAFLPKPFTEAMLLTTIHSVIRKDESSDDLVTRNEEKLNSSGTEKINLQNLYHISGGDERFVRQMLDTFIETTGNGLVAMNEAIESGQWETVSDLAHKISPPCRHIGAEDLLNFLKKIEENIRNHAETGPIKTLAKESAKEFETIRKLLYACIAKIK
jgi:HPt (histidine-containing phosphotransfer) domain-containing protein